MNTLGSIFLGVGIFIVSSSFVVILAGLLTRHLIKKDLEHERERKKSQQAFNWWHC